MIGPICQEDLVLLKVGVKTIRATPTKRDSAADTFWAFLSNFPRSLSTTSYEVPDVRTPWFQLYSQERRRNLSGNH